MPELYKNVNGFFSHSIRLFLARANHRLYWKHLIHGYCWIL